MSRLPELELRGSDLTMVITHELWEHGKVMLTPLELKIKQNVWEYYRGLSRSELERTFTVMDRTWVDYLLKLEKHIELRPQDGDGLFIDTDNIAPSRGPLASEGRGRRRSLPG